MKLLKLFTLLFSILFIGISCSKEDDDNGSDTPAYRQPSVIDREIVIEVPAGLENLASEGDVYATQAITYLSLANSLANYYSSFVIPQDVEPEATNGGGTLYSWSYGGFSYWMNFDVEGDNYNWTYDYAFPDQPRFTYIEAKENKDGTSGSWTIFNPDNPDEVLWTYSWSIDADDNFTATLNYGDESFPGEFVVVSNADESGQFIYKEDNTDQAKLEWNADGSGNYWFDNNGDPVSNSWDAE